MKHVKRVSKNMPAAAQVWGPVVGWMLALSQMHYDKWVGLFTGWSEGLFGIGSGSNGE